MCRFRTVSLRIISVLFLNFLILSITSNLKDEQKDDTFKSYLKDYIYYAQMTSNYVDSKRIEFYAKVETNQSNHFINK